MRAMRLVVLAAAAASLSGCFLTKLVTVPMRVTGAVASIIPVAGDAAHKVVDEAADTVDKLPI
ncbi:MAG: hypothetical protein HYZ75_19225 [Elusimicrobia bacterium]|nr:hypothetical protein [Elusimicrobiota bacterium]